MGLEPQTAVRMQRARGRGRLVTKQRDGVTRLDALYQDGCAKIRFPNTHNAALEAVLINTAGGLCGGDDIAWQASAAPGGRLVLTTQACERVYRSTAAAAAIGVTLTAAAGAHIDWLPQETILFEHANLDRRISIDLAEGATLCAVEAVLLGRDAMGETARNARLADRWRITRNGRLLHAEATTLGDEPDIERDAGSLLAGANAFATVLYVGADATRRLDAVRAALRPGARIAASAIGERLVVRATAHSGLDLRRAIVPIIALLSGAGSLPRLWST
jgi:urease accessory protein